MEAMYAVLAEADSSKQLDKEKKDRPRKAIGRRPSPAQHVLPATPPSPKPATTEHQRVNNSQQLPGININLQVHISADATPDQIDQIFASMAKHIYPRG
jgi:hypothetical protein